MIDTNWVHTNSIRTNSIDAKWIPTDSADTSVTPGPTRNKRRLWFRRFVGLSLTLLISCIPVSTFAADNSTTNTTPLDTTQLSVNASQTAPLPPIVINQTPVDGVPLVSNPLQFPSILSQAAVVLDMNTGTVVYAKNPNDEHYPASLTKMMTAILALKDGNLSDEITVSKNAADQPPDKLYFVPGEQHTLEQMLYGLLLISANDAAVAIAEHYGGSVANFATMMNTEAVSLGAYHTHFENPNGLPNPKHVTTAYDLALIARAAMQYPEFRTIVSTKAYDWQGQAWQSHLTNINDMLYNYPGCIGIKTGYTSVAHETLAVAATQNGQTFLAILMDTPTSVEIRRDATKLLNFAFAHYHTQVVLQQGAVVGHLTSATGASVPLRAQREVVATVENGQTFQPTSKLQLFEKPRSRTGGTRVGSLTFSAANQPSVVIPVLADEPLSVIAPPTPKGAAAPASHHVWLWWTLGGIVFLVLVGWFMRRRARRRRLRSYTVRSWHNTRY